MLRIVYCALNPCRKVIFDTLRSKDFYKPLGNFFRIKVNNMCCSETSGIDEVLEVITGTLQDIASNMEYFLLVMDIKTSHCNIAGKSL
jgi:hypothetical protein